MTVKEVLGKLTGMQIKSAKSRRIPIEFPQIDLDECYKVRSTMNYDIFKIMYANRDIDHAKVILKCILKIGYLPIPIIVNENYEIVDGQGRFTALKELGYPIYYMVVPGLRIDHVRRINFAMTRWRVSTYVKSYSSDHIDYAYLSNLKKQFPRYTDRVLDAAGGRTLSGGGGNTNRMIQEGKYTMTSTQYDDAVKVLTWMEQFADYFDNKKLIAGSVSHLYIAMIFAYKNPSVNKQRLASTFREYARRTDKPEMTLQAVGSVIDCLRRLENMYNFRAQVNTRVYLVNDYERAINAEKRSKK